MKLRFPRGIAAIKGESGLREMLRRAFQVSGRGEGGLLEELLPYLPKGRMRGKDIPIGIGPMQEAVSATPPNVLEGGIPESQGKMLTDIERAALLGQEQNPIVQAIFEQVRSQPGYREMPISPRETDYEIGGSSIKDAIEELLVKKKESKLSPAHAKILLKRILGREVEPPYSGEEQKKITDFAFNKVEPIQETRTRIQDLREGAGGRMLDMPIEDARAMVLQSLREGAPMPFSGTSTYGMRSTPTELMFGQPGEMASEIAPGVRYAKKSYQPLWTKDMRDVLESSFETEKTTGAKLLQKPTDIVMALIQAKSAWKKVLKPKSLARTLWEKQYTDAVKAKSPEAIGSENAQEYFENMLLKYMAQEKFPSRLQGEYRILRALEIPIDKATKSEGKFTEKVLGEKVSMPKEGSQIKGFMPEKPPLEMQAPIGGMKRLAREEAAAKETKHPQRIAQATKELKKELMKEIRSGRVKNIKEFLKRKGYKE